ncbi:hypothetical protein X769_07570 [Mesorhizobium sp. LSJC268A00]|nr:hypothetical protein X769_07570 [Mesorhizobium sp. LSJC268A00]
MKYLNGNRGRDVKNEFARKKTRLNTLCFSYMRADGIGLPQNSVRKPQPYQFFRSYFP